MGRLVWDRAKLSPWYGGLWRRDVHCGCTASQIRPVEDPVLRTVRLSCSWVWPRRLSGSCGRCRTVGQSQGPELLSSHQGVETVVRTLLLPSEGKWFRYSNCGITLLKSWFSSKHKLLNQIAGNCITLSFHIFLVNTLSYEGEHDSIVTRSIVYVKFFWNISCQGNRSINVTDMFLLWSNKYM